MIGKDLVGYISLIFVVAAEVPYICMILKGAVKPHAFSRIIWLILVATAAAAQYSAHAGPGAWATMLSTAFFAAIAVLSFSHGERNVTRNDWIAFLAALAAIPLWYFTADPLLTVLLVTLIDALGYYPTFRKSWSKPREESVFLYSVANLKHLTSIAAMASFSATTLIYPVTLFLLNSALIALLAWRRRLPGKVSGS